MILANIVQIILALFLVFILLFVAYLIYNYESMINLRNKLYLKKEIIIFDGIMDFTTTQWTFNTYNKSFASFKDLTPSINQNGGAEYSYNFWLCINKDAMKYISSSDIVLLMRGSKIKVPYINNTNCEIVNKGSYVIVKNPLIRMKSDGTAMIIEYNTITNPDAYRENGTNVINCGSGSWMDKNKGLLGIYNMSNYVYNKKWFMFTMVLREITPENDVLYKNKTNCRVYINGINVLDRTVESPYNGAYGSAAMKHNRAPLHVNPGDIFSTIKDDTTNPIEAQSGISTALQMANLTYFNYALSESDITGLFQKKFTQEAARAPMDNETFQEDKYSIAAVSENSNNLPLAF
jgi:hypothetical protein